MANPMGQALSTLETSPDIPGGHPENENLDQRPALESGDDPTPVEAPGLEVLDSRPSFESEGSLTLGDADAESFDSSSPGSNQDEEGIDLSLPPAGRGLLDPVEQEPVVWGEFSRNDVCEQISPGTNNRAVESYVGAPVITFLQNVSSVTCDYYRRDSKDKNRTFTRSIRADGAVAVPLAFETGPQTLTFCLPRPKRILAAKDADKVKIVQRGVKGRDFPDHTAYLSADKLIVYVPDKDSRQEDVLALSPCKQFPLGAILVNLDCDPLTSERFRRAKTAWTELELFKIALRLREKTREKGLQTPMEIAFDVLPDWEHSRKDDLTVAELAFLRQSRVGCLPDTIEVAASLENTQKALLETLQRELDVPEQLIALVRDASPGEFKELIYNLKGSHPHLFESSAEAVGAPVSTEDRAFDKEDVAYARTNLKNSAKPEGSPIERVGNSYKIVLNTPTISTDLEVLPAKVEGAKKYILEGAVVRTYQNSSPFLTECMGVVGRQVVAGRAKFALCELKGRVTTLTGSARPNRLFEPHIGGKMPMGVRWQEKLEVKLDKQVWLPIPTSFSGPADLMYIKEVIMLALYEVVTGPLNPGSLITFQTGVFTGKTLNHEILDEEVPRTDMSMDSVRTAHPLSHGMMFQQLQKAARGPDWFYGRALTNLPVSHALDVRTRLPSGCQNIDELYHTHHISLTGLVPPHEASPGVVMLRIHTREGEATFPIPEHGFNGATITYEDVQNGRPTEVYDKITKRGKKHPALKTPEEEREVPPAELVVSGSGERKKKSKKSELNWADDADSLASQSTQGTSRSERAKSRSANLEEIFEVNSEGVDLDKKSDTDGGEKGLGALLAGRREPSKALPTLKWEGIWKGVPKGKRKSFTTDLLKAIHYGRAFEKLVLKAQDSSDKDALSKLLKRSCNPEMVFQGFHVRYLEDAKAANPDAIVELPGGPLANNFKLAKSPPWK